MLRLPGAGNVLRRFQNEILPRGGRVWLQISTGPARGLWLKVEPYLEERYLSGCPEPGVQGEIVNHLRAGACLYDVGAHIGFYSLLAARLVGGDGRVVAFEPDPANASVLQANVSRNGLSQVEVIQAALWSHCGVVTFQRSAAEHPELSSRRGTVVPSHATDLGSRLIEVEAVKLDAFSEYRCLPTMIKIDVEGGEIDVVNGAERLIALSRPVLLIEVHHQQAAVFLEKHLRQREYRLDWLAGHPHFAFPRHLLARPEKQAPTDHSDDAGWLR